jgi:hypothetical protein
VLKQKEVVIIFFVFVSYSAASSEVKIVGNLHNPLHPLFASKGPLTWYSTFFGLPLIIEGTTRKERLFKMPQMAFYSKIGF